ncbi:50S ribosomal protein L10 [Candidatus Parcubacteria bacterium]|nr:50S ribosomal protein L10 [Candidatus Parcubacteria bacterium]
MAKTKEEKQKIIQELKEKIKKQKSIVFVDFSGLEVKAITELRKEMRKQDCEFKVAKKTFIEIALKDFKEDIAKKAREMDGEIGIGFGYKDEVMPFKILGDCAKEQENLKLLAGLIGDEFLGQEETVAMSKLPSREEVVARIVGSISAPISNFVNVLQGNIKGLLQVLTTIKSS